MASPKSETAPTVFDGLIQDPKIRRVFAAAALGSLKVAQKVSERAYVELVSRFSAYESYLSTTYRKVATIKTFAAPTQPVSLLDHFVDTNLSDGDSEFDQYDLVTRINSGCRLVVSALAGFGKSVLLRYLALSLYESPAGRIPIFIELRDLNRMKTPDIVSYIHATYKQTSDLDQSVFERGLELGLFAIFLDGFDEVNFDRREEIENNILRLSDSYPHISLVVSGRPDSHFESWREFSVYKIAPMNVAQVRDLIRKIEFDEGLKHRFLKKLDDGLYEKHSSFLSTPLLATLMMLTYQQNAAIPDKMHLFYQRAFETLFDKHDTYKEQYERKRKSKLRIDEFSRLFSVFCMNTYLGEQFEFSKTSILEALETAIEYCGYDVDADDVLFDLAESVCLLQSEGLFYSFVHRSFQEYFSALFLCNCADDLRDEFLDEFVYRPWDSVLTMLFDMAKERLEASWVLQRTKRYLEYVDPTGSGDVGVRPLTARWKGINLVVKDEIASFGTLSSGPFAMILYALSRFYPSSYRRWDYLNIEMIDAVSLKYAAERGLTYADYRRSIQARHGDGKKQLYFDFETCPDPVVGSEMLSGSMAEFRDIQSIASEIDSQILVKQKLIGKMRRHQ